MGPNPWQGHANFVYLRIGVELTSNQASKRSNNLRVFLVPMFWRAGFSLISLILPLGLALALASTSVSARLVSTKHSTRIDQGTDVLHLVAHGETLASILTGLGASYREVAQWRDAGKKQYDLRRILPGHWIRARFERQSGKLKGLEYEITPTSVLSLELGSGGIVAASRQASGEVSLRSITAVVESSIYSAASRVGVPDRVISELADIFAWEIDFSSEIQPGDRLKLVYEEIGRAGGSHQAGRVLAAEIVSGDTTLSAIYYKDNRGRGRYYDVEGRPLGRSFLRYPLAFTRISSRFTWARKHPVLKRRRPHLGVDLVASRGTPVRVVGEGRVRSVGWQRGYGRTVRVSHGLGYETLYAHLQRYAHGLRRGRSVRKGQTIGYVGSSGLATGPHLHFAMFKNGRYVNPLTARIPVAQGLVGKNLITFLHESRELRERLAALDRRRPQRLSLLRPASSLLLDAPRSPLASHLY